MLIALGLIVLGLLLLVAGGETLLRGAVGLASWMKLSPAVIGLTVVAAGTSVPELSVSLIAALRGSPDLAVGNVVGSNIFNISFIVGLCALLLPLSITGNTIRLEYPAAMLATLACVEVCFDGLVNRLDGVLFLAAYVGFTAFMVRLVRTQLSAAESQGIGEEVSELTPATAAGQPRLGVCVLFLTLGIVLLGGGAQATVLGAIDLAQRIGLSERVIGLTILAAGTGLPEVVTSLVAVYKRRDDIAVANVVGSNIFNILVILGFSAVVSPIPVSAPIIAFDNWWMLGLTVIFFPMLYTGRRVNRWEGLALLTSYVVYTGILLSRDAGG